MVSYVLTGNFLRSEQGFDLNWQLLDVASQRVRSGGAIRVASLDLIAVQTEISNEVFAALYGLSAAERIEAMHAEDAAQQPAEWLAAWRGQRRVPPGPRPAQLLHVPHRVRAAISIGPTRCLPA